MRERDREKGDGLGNLSHPHSELFVGHGVDPVDCVSDRISLRIFKMFFALVLNMIREGLRNSDERE
jgi:hypothetical protein